MKPNKDALEMMEKYKYMNEKSSAEGWNDGFGLIILDVFEEAVRNGKAHKTIKQLVDEIEIKFNA